MFHAGLLRWSLEGAHKAEDVAKRRAAKEEDVPEPSSAFKEVAIWEVEEAYLLMGGLCKFSKEAKA